ncbi:mucus-binding protein [Lactobacillus pentosus]|uniref:Mucus-binding protein n=1 Tax=Lactiplantibacillus pentosus TaxID=1589 RepID=A0AB37RH07_LACPE|nr:KxYKxGKxW signal peptide domain-containing protein [Lactiplantibacillus pentosus]MPQ18214.1 mucus-binding protein [Lactiplantibacillus pentosus]RMW41557.1 mucus-binding protein [Lactiplantibacillus pentosus]RMW42755.1 mucus-binding protein [Lactiplantibacillus pentosus]RMW53471.1 mucus-binding protein [Lactiplantibacillus pentosus]RMW56672.1 mucus-binding protein [Lactiplantibacillus pentosus]
MKNRFNQMGLTSKTHFKLYKSGRRWVTAGITVFSVGLGLTFSQVEQVKAATSTAADDAESSSNVNASATTVKSQTVVLKSGASSTTEKADTAATASTAAKTTSTAKSDEATKTDSGSTGAKTDATTNSSRTATKTGDEMATTATDETSTVNASSDNTKADTTATVSSDTVVSQSETSDTQSTVASKSDSASVATTNQATTDESTGTSVLSDATTPATTQGTKDDSNTSNQNGNQENPSTGNSTTDATTDSSNDSDSSEQASDTASESDVAVNASVDSSATPMTRLRTNATMAALSLTPTTTSTSLTTKSAIQAVSAVASADETQATVSLATKGTVTMTYHVNNAALNYLGDHISGPEASPDNDIAYNIQDAAGNYLTDTNGQKVNLLYLLFMDVGNVKDYFDIAYKDVNGQVTNYNGDTDLAELDQVGTYAFTLSAAGKSAMADIIQEYATYYDLADDVNLDDYVPTFSAGASDYTFTVKILPATITNKGVGNILLMAATSQEYSGSLTMLPQVTVRDGSSKIILQIKNGVITAASDDIAGQANQTILTAADFTDTYQGTEPNLTGADVGSYTMTLNAAGQAAIQAALGSNYVLDASSVFTKTSNKVTAAPLQLTAADDTVTYDGKAHGTSVSVTSGTAYDQFDFTTPTEINAGSYTMTAGLADADQAALLAKNYTVTKIDGTLVIKPAALTVTVNNASVDYDGQAHGTTASVTSGTNYDALTFTAVTADGSGTATETNAGAYAMTGTTADATQNYQITYVNGTLTINTVKATITIPSQVYWVDGTTKNLTATVSGTVNGESLSYRLTDGMSSVGTKTITATVDQTSAVNQNYQIGVTPGTLTLGDVDVVYRYEYIDADGQTHVVATDTGRATHGTDVTAANYLNYTTVGKPKTGYTLKSDNTGIAANGTLSDEGGTVVYVYLANTETATVTYVDGTTGATLTAAPLEGAYGTTSDYRTADTIANYENNGYALVSDNYPNNGVSFDEDGTVKSFQVTLVHKFVTVTPDDPGYPGEPIEPDNPNGPKYPVGTATDDLTEAVRQTIEYRYQNGSQAVADNVQTLTFSRTATVDEVNQAVVYTDWLTSGAITGAYQTVVSPVITGYTADKLSVAGQDSVTGASDNTTIVVTYQLNQETATVTYVDGTTGETLEPKTLTGDYQTLSDYQTADTIAKYLDLGYQLASDNFPTSGQIFDEDGVVQTYTVTLTHKLVTVTPDDPGYPGEPIDPDNPNGPTYPVGTTTADLTKSIRQTINYRYQNGSQAAADNVQTVTFKRSGTVDEVANTVVYTDWNTGNARTGTYTAVTSPIMTGYTADKLSVASNDGVANTDLNTQITVTYTANQEQATVTYIDATTGKTLSIDSLTGGYQTTSDYSTAATIAKYGKAGYALVTDDYPVSGNIFANDGNPQTYTVTLTHKLVTVTPDDPGTPGEPIDPDNPDGPTYPVGTAIDDLTKAVRQTINYRYQDGSQAAADNVQTVMFTRTATVDEVANTVVYTDWTNGSDTTGTYAPVTSPVMTGYTVDQSRVAGTDVVTSKDSDTNVVVTYTANQEQATVTYIDETTGKTLSIQRLSGDYHTASAYRTAATIASYVNQGYELLSDDYPTSGQIFDQDGVTQAYTVKLGHQLITVTPDQPGTPGQPIDPDNPAGPSYPAGTAKTDLTKDVLQTINYRYQNGRQAAADNVQTVTFTRTATVDEVDHLVIIYTDWTSGDGPRGIYQAMTSPTITGYTPDQSRIAGNNAVTSDDQNTTLTVTYAPNQETAFVSYVDGTTGKTLATKQVTGAYQSKSDYRTADQIATYVQAGYELVSDDFPTSGLIFNQDGVKQTYTVKLGHKLITVTPDEPGTPGQPIDPDNPAGPTYPRGTAVQDLTKSVSQTIHYQFSDGRSAGTDQVQTLTFDRTATIDEVDGTLVYTAWLNGTTATGRYTPVATPQITGYTADQQRVAGNEAVTSADQNTDVVVTYTLNTEQAVITYVDATTGKTLATKTLTGDYQTASAYRTAATIASYVSRGYELTSDDFPTSGLIFNHDGVATHYLVRLAHGTDATTTTKTITQTVRYQDGAGKQLHADTVRTLTFSRADVVDKVTGDVTAGAWSSNDAGSTFASVPALSITGYRATVAGIPAVTVTPTSGDDVQTIRYVADEPNPGETPKTPNKTVTVTTPDKITPAKKTPQTGTQQKVNQTAQTKRATSATKQADRVNQSVQAKRQVVTLQRKQSTRVRHTAETKRPAAVAKSVQSTASIKSSTTQAPVRQQAQTHKQATLPQTGDDRQASVAAEILGLTAATLLVGLGALLKKRRN